ncbi:MAG: sulfatase [Asticcacaulis sp.]
MTKSKPTRRTVVSASLAASALAAPALTNVAQAATGSPERPNILWLVSEDNNPLIGAYGDNLAHTPHLDALAAKGLLYKNVYSVAPVCAPSRFAILTGLHPETCAPAHHMRAIGKLPKAFATYPELLRKAGYYVTNNSKTDYNCDVDPAAIWDVQGKDGHWKNRPEDKPFMAVFNNETTHESRIFKPTTGRITPDQITLPAFLPDTPGIRQDYASYYNLMEVMDSEIGGKLKELDDAGLSDDTIVFYYSDNGGVLPRSKRHCYEQGLRTALIVYIPPKWAHLAPAIPGSVIDNPVTFVDLPPTLLALAGIEAPAHMQGKAFLGQHKKASATYAFAMRNRMDENYDFVRTVTDTRYRYIRNYFPHRPAGQHIVFEWAARGYQDWDAAFRAGKLNAVQKAFFLPRAFEELYDLQADPDQVRNLATDSAHRVMLTRLSDALDSHMIRINDNGFIPEALPGEGYHESRDSKTYPLKAIIALANLAGHRDPANAALFVSKLSNDNPVIRYWAATGLLILAENAQPFAPSIAATLYKEAVPQIRVVLAETLIRADTKGTGARNAGITALTALLDPLLPWQINLQALNAWVALNPTVKAPADALTELEKRENGYLTNAVTYLSQINTGTFDPHKPILDWDAFIQRMRAAGVG